MLARPERHARDAGKGTGVRTHGLFRQVHGTSAQGPDAGPGRGAAVQPQLHRHRAPAPRPRPRGRRCRRQGSQEPGRRAEQGPLRGRVHHRPRRRAVVGEIGLTPRAKKVIELAVDEARRLGHNYIGTEHLLLGLVREGEGIAAGVLESLGVEPGEGPRTRSPASSSPELASQPARDRSGASTHAHRSTSSAST